MAKKTSRNILEELEAVKRAVVCLDDYCAKIGDRMQKLEEKFSALCVECTRALEANEVETLFNALEYLRNYNPTGAGSERIAFIKGEIAAMRRRWYYFTRKIEGKQEVK
jgi:uridine kinase